MKTESEKFNKYKKKVGTEMDTAKKTVNEKEKQVYKLK